MKKLIFPAFALGLAVLMLQSPSVGGPRGGGGRGAAAGRGGAVAGPGGAAGGYSRGGAVQGYGGGAGAGARSGAGVVGPAGGSAQAGRASGSYTTGRGTTVDYGAAGRARTTPGGASAGRAVGGVQVTGPGGREVTKAGQAGGVSGPGGRAVGGRESVTAGSGPRGAYATHSQGAAARGPGGGVVAGGSRAGVAAGHGGVAVGGSRGAVAAGGYGVAAGRTTGVARSGTYYRSGTTMYNQGVYVRRSVSTYPCFRATWYRANPGAWYAAAWTGGAVWCAATWNSCATYCGIVAEPIYYDYGVNVAYQDDGIYYDGEKLAGQDAYYERATELADTGRDAKVSKDQEWLPLGVFALVSGEEKTSNNIFQLSVNKSGVIRGTYYDAVTDTSSVVSGLVDKKSQRAAWTVGDRKTPVYEAGIANLTRDETTMIVHYGKDRSAQFSLVRVENPDKLD